MMSLNKLLIKSLSYGLESQYWIKISLSLFANPGDPFLMTQLQELGRIDSLLRFLEHTMPSISPQENIMGFGLICSLSHLWVFGLYELCHVHIRQSQQLKKFTAKIQELRCPLAKHQVSGKSQAHFPRLLLSNRRYDWKYFSPIENKIVFVIREALSDEFLSICGISKKSN